MALLVYGTLCPLCGEPMIEGQKLRVFSPFVANEADPLWGFSDRAFHEDCFRRHPLADRVERRWRETTKHRSPERRICILCKSIINNPNEYISFGHLTEDTSNPLHRLNFAAFHRACLSNWSDISYIYSLATMQITSGLWKGHGMKWLVDTLQQLRDQGEERKF